MKSTCSFPGNSFLNSANTGCIILHGTHLSAPNSSNLGSLAGWAGTATAGLGLVDAGGFDERTHDRQKRTGRKQRGLVRQRVDDRRLLGAHDGGPLWVAIAPPIEVRLVAGSGRPSALASAEAVTKFGLRGVF